MQVSSGRMHQGDDTFRVIQGIRSCQVSTLRPHLLPASPSLMQSPSSLSPATIIAAITSNDRHMHIHTHTSPITTNAIASPFFLRRDNKAFHSHLFPLSHTAVDALTPILSLSGTTSKHGYACYVNKITVIIAVVSVCPILREGSHLTVPVCRSPANW